MPLSQTTCLDNGTLNEEAVDCLVSAVPSTPPPTPVVVDITEEVFRMPLYLEHAREGSPQLNMLVELVLAMSADGKFVQATATCDEISSPFPRIGSTRHVSLLSDATIYVPSDIMLSPVHVIVRKIRGLALDVSWYRLARERELTKCNCYSNALPSSSISSSGSPATGRRSRSWRTSSCFPRDCSRLLGVCTSAMRTRCEVGSM